MEIKKYEIDERTARTAKEINSFRDYKENEATNSYNGYLQRFKQDVEELIEDYKQNVNDEVMDLIKYYSDKYSKKLAFAINKSNRIEAMCPSVMICGAGNFPTRKKQKQNQARENYWNEYGSLFEEDNYYMKKIRNLLTNKVIASDDELAIEKLEAKIDKLSEQQDIMKRANAWYRKNKTMVGFEDLRDEDAKRMDNRILESWYKTPYASFELTNNNANIKRLKERVESIKKLKERAEQKEESKYIQVDGLEVVEDSTDMRIRIIFDDIPSAETRDLLKHNGFKWSPKNNAWQRQLTSNGIYATKRFLENIKNNEY